MEIVALPQHPVGGGLVGSACREDRLASDDTAPAIGVSQPLGLPWQAELRRAVREPSQLLAALELPDSLADQARRAAGNFPLFAPWPFINRMRKGDAADPLLRQVLPLADELDSPAEFSADPVGDAAARQTP